MANSKVIWALEYDSLSGGHWTDEIICTERKNKTFSLRGQRRGDDGTLRLASELGIKSAESLAKAILNCWSLFEVETEADDVNRVCVELSSLNPEIGAQVRAAFLSVQAKTETLALK